MAFTGVVRFHYSDDFPKNSYTIDKFLNKFKYDEDFASEVNSGNCCFIIDELSMIPLDRAYELMERVFELSKFEDTFLWR